MNAPTLPAHDGISLEYRIAARLGDYAAKLGIPVAIVIIATGLGIALGPWLHEGYAALVLVAAMAVIGATSGLYIAVVCALSGALAFNYFIADPVYSISYTHPYDFIPPAVFVFCAVISALISGRARDQAQAARAARARIEHLLEFSRVLQTAETMADVRTALIAEVDRHGTQYALYWAAQAGLERIAGDPGTPDTVQRLADGVGSGPTVQRLETGAGLCGALVCRTTRSGGFADSTDQLGMIEGLARLANLALARVQLATELTDQRARARIDQLQSALLMAFSHDLRTPLTTIGTAAQSLGAYADSLDPATRAELTRTIARECDRLSRLTANLMQLTRLEAGDVAPDAAPIAIDDMLRHCLRRAGPDAGARQVVARLGAGLAAVRADTALFELAIANILQNAIKFSLDGSTITVASTIAGHRGVITISDQGCGVPPAEHDRVFQRFHRAVDQRTGPPGSGLGLAIARGFVEAAGGAIVLASPGPDGCGTVVTIDLPLAEEDEPA